MSRERINKRFWFIIRSLFVLAISWNMCLLSFAGVAQGKWYKDEQGWWFGKDDGGDYSYYYVNTWSIIFDEEGGKFYSFDENGYLRTNQITPDGYCVNEDGELIVNGQTVKVEYTHRSIPCHIEGDDFIGRWVTTYGSAQRQDKDNLKPIDHFKGKPTEILIYRDDNRDMYLEVYSLKNGERIKTNTYDFKYGSSGKKPGRDSVTSLKYDIFIIEGEDQRGREGFVAEYSCLKSFPVAIDQKTREEIDIKDKSWYFYYKLKEE